jgi:hypothetical protein
VRGKPKTIIASESALFSSFNRKQIGDDSNSRLGENKGLSADRETVSPLDSFKPRIAAATMNQGSTAGGSLEGAGVFDETRCKRWFEISRLCGLTIAMIYRSAFAQQPTPAATPTLASGSGAQDR